MPRAGVEVKLNLPAPDIRATKEAIHEEMAAFTIEQLRTWVLHTVDPIPVWSGAARASFLFLAAKAYTSITINPIAPSRLSLGIMEAKAEVIAEPGGEYGWTWESDLRHIGIVEDRVGFIQKGFDSIAGGTPSLPQPVMKSIRV